MTTTDLLKRPISLYANRDNNGYAYGTVYLSQGEKTNEDFEYY